MGDSCSPVVTVVHPVFLEQEELVRFLSSALQFQGIIWICVTQIISFLVWKRQLCSSC